MRRIEEKDDNGMPNGQMFGFLGRSMRSNQEYGAVRMVKRSPTKRHQAVILRRPLFHFFLGPYPRLFSDYFIPPYKNVSQKYWAIN